MSPFGSDHQRLKLWKNTRSRYFRAIEKAHMDHHYGKKNYGFLFMIPWRYFREEFAAQKAGKS